MLQQSRFWAITALVATFAAGGLFGWVLGTRAHGGPRGWALRGGGPPGPDGMISFLSERLTFRRRSATRCERFWSDIAPTSRRSGARSIRNSIRCGRE